MKIVGITQVRLKSSRLPEKILMEVANSTLLDIHLERLKKARLLDEICVATTKTPNNNSIENIVKRQKVSLSYGSEHDVLDRYYKAAIKMKADYIVRVTSDCPLIDPILIDKIVKSSLEKNVDYYSNILIEDFPDGQDIEVIKIDALEKAWKYGKLPHHREHVTTYIKENCTFNNGKLFTSGNHQCPENYNHVRLTVDYIEDYYVIKDLINDLGTNQTWEDYTSHYLKTPNIFSKNKGFTRNVSLKNI